MNRLHFECRKLNCAALEQALDFFPHLLTVEAIVQFLLLFVYIHNKNKYLGFCKISLKNWMWHSAVWFSFAQHKNEPKRCILGYLHIILLFNIYLYISSFSPLAEVLEVRNVI